MSIFNYGVDISANRREKRTTLIPIKISSFAGAEPTRAQADGRGPGSRHKPTRRMDIRQREINGAGTAYLEYSDGRIAVIDALPGMANVDRERRVNGVVFILCMSGSMSFHVDDRRYTAHANDVVVVLPEAVIDNGETSGDFTFRCMYISLDYAFNMLPLSSRGWNFKMFFEQHPRFTMTEEGVETFNKYYELLKKKLADKSNPYRGNLIDGLMQALVFEFRRVFDGYAGLGPRPLSSAENIFDAFTGLLESSYPKPRAVTYYADKLSITAKYLSVVCKKACGKSASKIIDAYVSKDIEHLLRNSRKSIKEISNELDFPNTSFFGRYVKKYFGCTPVELRRKLNGVDVIRNA